MNNPIEKETAKEIAKEFGFTFEQVEKDFDYANQVAASSADRDCQGNRNHAERYFRGYLNDRQFESNCESKEALRNEERAFGSRYGDRDFDF